MEAAIAGGSGLVLPNTAQRPIPARRGTRAICLDAVALEEEGSEHSAARNDDQMILALGGARSVPPPPLSIGRPTGTLGDDADEEDDRGDDDSDVMCAHHSLHGYWGFASQRGAGCIARNCASLRTPREPREGTMAMLWTLFL